MNKFNIVKLFIYENKRKIIIIMSLLLVFLSVTFLFLNKDTFKKESVVYENLLHEDELVKEKEEKQEEIIYYFVDVKGIEKGKRVVDAINKAGGVKKDANTTLLNLSMELHDEMVIIVYSNEEVNKLSETKQKEEKQEVICNQEIVNDACICNQEITNENTDVSEEGKESSDNYEKDVGSEKININKATIDELMTLSKIGESKAKAIIEYRDINGSFKTIEDIKNVSGIGDTLFESLKDYITV